VAEARPLAPWNKLHKVGFNFVGIPLFRKFKTMSEPRHVSINHDAFVLTKSVSEHNVRRFAADPWERNQFGHRTRDLSVITFQEILGHGAQIPGLIPVKPCALDQILELGLVDLSEIFWIATLSKQVARYQVYTFVGALC
jgi:hypothetical protein